jgi:DNA polymerase-3 subunit gamma/tau
MDHLLEICEKENIPADRSSLEIIAQKSEGCMRDALSIMDKMVSFSDGKLSYADTLENLNILDEGYYFKLLAAIRGQQLSEALLIFDEINRKGFEGDLLLNGFAEFIRNLLICRDEKAARLLEVVEAFKDRYLEEAKNVDLAFLISALNILSDSELNYKAARNKRLHVELALIKLSYLNQALHISQTATETKKGTEAAKPVAYRLIAPLEIKLKKSQGKIQEPDPIKEEPGKPPDSAVKLIIEEPKTPVPKTTSPGALSKIRQEVVNRKSTAGEVKCLEQGPLMEAWTQFTTALKTNKNSAAQSFEGAELRILDEHRFEILTNNNLEQRFIEQEKRRLSDLLQEHFQNKNISFSVSIRENFMQQMPKEKMLSKRDQFFQIIEIYPLVKELKDKLKLELDY